jgi:flagellar biosynthesis/type III secretory pathway protein FliH
MNTTPLSRLAERMPAARPPFAPVSPYQYREIPSLPRPAGRPAHVADPLPASHAEVEMTMAEFEARLGAARREGAQEAEARARAEARREIEAANAKVSSALLAFAEEQSAYFARVEGEVVRLALSVAGKILHREAQVDPMLVGALVQIALNQLREGTVVTVRVPPAEATRWREHFAARPQIAAVTVAEDPELEPGGCVLQTELGEANFSLAAQLKEVEQGFFDLLSQTPRR